MEARGPLGCCLERVMRFQLETCPYTTDRRVSMRSPSQAGSWEGAMKLLTEMHEEGMRPAGFAVAATIRACSSAGQWTKGLQVLRQSQQVKPSKPDPCSLGAAVEMCCRAGKLVSAQPWRNAGSFARNERMKVKSGHRVATEFKVQTTAVLAVSLLLSSWSKSPSLQLQLL